MNAKLKLHNSVTTKKGHPIIIYLSDSYKDKRIRIGHHSLIKDWNEKLSEPKKSHPNFYELHRKCQKIKEKLSVINYECRNIDDALIILNTKSGTTFFEICSKGLYKLETKYSALNSFNKFAPNINHNEITTDLVNKYIKEKLKKQSPGGLDSYIRSLKALWNANYNQENPFKVKVSIPTKENIVVSDQELKILQKVELKGQYNDYRNYFLLMFYLGGIDFEVLVRLKKNEIKNDRINFNRQKGNSDVFCSNRVFDCAKELFYEGDYIVPVHKYSYREYRSNFSRRFPNVCKEIGVSPIKSKTARYTFINRAQEQLIDERITSQIVGHKRTTTTSLYTNDFPKKIQDKAHFKIITL